MEAQGHNHYLDAFLLMAASVTGVAGLSLQEIDIISGIILKWVSILSFLLVIILNWKKVKDRIFKQKDNDTGTNK